MKSAIRSAVITLVFALGGLSASALGSWRWTSNATAASPSWNEVASEALAVPAFTGATAADNVLELLGECSVLTTLSFTKDCTIRTKPGLAAQTVTFAKGMAAGDDAAVHNAYCAAAARVVTSNVVFQGNFEWTKDTVWDLAPCAAQGAAGYANVAWIVQKSLTFGPGTTIRNFLISTQPSAVQFVGGAVVVYDKATFDLEDGAKIVDCRGATPPVTVVNKSVGAVVNIKGGEITRCYSQGGRSGGAIGALQGTINLTGGSIHDNIGTLGCGGVWIEWGGGSTAPQIVIRGRPVIRDNFLRVNGQNVPSDLSAANSDFIELFGELEEGAYVGCSLNVGAGNVFGVVCDGVKGAQKFHASGNDALVGRRTGLKLRWAAADAAVDEDVPVAERALKVLAVGGGIARAWAAQWPAVADSLGFRLDLMTLSLEGATVKTHWERRAETGVYAFKTAFADWPNYASRLSAANSSLLDVLKAEKWDVVAFEPNMALAADSLEPGFGDLVDWVRLQAPTAEIVLAQDVPLAIGHPDVGDMAAADARYDAALASLQALAAAHGISRIVPVGFALQSALHTYNHDLGYWAAGGAGLSSPAGEYLAACVAASFFAAGGLDALDYAPSGMDATFVGRTRTVAAGAAAADDLTKYKDIRWRWASDAGAASPRWHEMNRADFILPGFIGEWTGDNVIELVDDCVVSNEVVFTGRLTIRSKPGATREIRFLGPNARFVCDGTVVASNVTFRGDAEWAEAELSLAGRFGLELASGAAADCARSAWRVNAGAFLTLGAGATVKNFCPRYAEGGGAIHNAGGVVTFLEGSAVTDNRGNCGAVTSAGEYAAVNVLGGEFARNYVAELANPRLASGSALMAAGDGGRFNLRGGFFHDNFTRSDSHGGAIGLNARAGTAGAFVAGGLVVTNNYNITLAEDGTVESSTLMNLYVRDPAKLALAGDLADAAAVGVYAADPAEDDADEDTRPRIRFGVCSDLHLNVTYRDSGYFERALRWWKREGVDAIVIAGDLTDAGDVESAQLVADAITAVYGEEWPPVIAVLGDHDGFGDAAARRDVLRSRLRMGAATDENAFFTEVKGYRFVGRSWPHGGGFSMSAFLAEHAAELKDGRPFVFVQHPHPAATCHGPAAAGQESEVAGMESAAEFLRAYPNAIAFSGHSHTQLCDERSIWKDGFISVGTGSMAAQVTPPGRENSTVAVFKPAMAAAEACGYCAELVTLYDHEMKVERHEFVTSEAGEQIGPDWRVPLGEAGEWTFERRAMESLAPAFADDAEVSVRRYVGPLRDASAGSYNLWEVSFPTARAHDGRPRAIDYEVTAVVGLYDHERRAVKRVLSPHYGRAEAIDDEVKCLVADVDELSYGAKHVYFEVRPVSPFGKAGAPIKSMVFKR